MVSSHSLPEGFNDLDVFGLGTALLVEGLIGFIFNGLTLLSFYKVKELRTPSNFFVFSLAASDIGICMNAFIAAFSSFLRYWPYGSEGCQIHGFHGFLTALSSISTCAVIAWDRYHQYCTRTKLQWSTAITVMVIVWGCSAFWSAMPLVGWGEYDYEPLRTCCTLDYTKRDRNFVSYVLPMAFFNFVVPVLLILSSYQSVYQKFKKTGQMKFNTGLPLKSLVFCWGPYSIMCLYAVFEDITAFSPKLRMIPAIMAKTSPMLNAFLYALGNENYRGGIWEFLTGQKIEVVQPDNKSK
ncbi:retinal G protein coupled receptor a [Erpetoichthys calabaricus]|uniref:RPE-retinal G protein-coupled receptor n=1 Tax=Erpetoichthys calabaricus TaxID=27687 RepID=A0A8C4RT06_ERPCA|nr:retinal G protein coupled receptor a [Erpetoichthys calabaricus]